MKVTLFISVSLQALAVVGSAVEIRNPLQRSIASTRPSIVVGPKTLGKALPITSAARDTVCSVVGGTADDSAAILEAFQSCNGSGHVIFEADTTYTIGKALDLRNLQSVDWGESPIPFRHRETFADIRSHARYPRNNQVHKRHRLLASELLQVRFPGVVYILGARRYRCERLWGWPHRWWRSGMVGSDGCKLIDAPAATVQRRWAEWWDDFESEDAESTKLVQSRTELK